MTIDLNASNPWHIMQGATHRLQLRSAEQLHQAQIAHQHWREAMSFFENGSIEELERVVTEHPLVLEFCTHEDNDHFQLIHLAARRGDVSALKVLLDAGADIDAKSGWYVPTFDGPIYFDPGYTPLIVAVIAEEIEAVEYLLSRLADHWLSATRGGGVLDFAVATRNVRLVNVLLSGGVSPNISALQEIKDSQLGKLNDLVPLHLAVLNNDIACVEAFINGGALLDLRDDRYRTPLFLAVFRGYFEIAKLLLEHGADPNKSEGLGNFVVTSNRMPLHVALEHGDDAMADLLISHGAIQNLAVVTLDKSMPWNQFDDSDGRDFAWHIEDGKKCHAFHEARKAAGIVRRPSGDPFLDAYREASIGFNKLPREQRLATTFPVKRGAGGS